jgi:hypothetical protein
VSKLADARVIAIAPELLETLIELTTTRATDNRGRRSYKKAYESMISHARAAIAKAIGSHP